MRNIRPRSKPQTDRMAVKSFETSGGEVYDSEAWTFNEWDHGLVASNENERLAFPWAAITMIKLEPV